MDCSVCVHMLYRCGTEDHVTADVIGALRRCMGSLGKKTDRKRRILYDLMGCVVSMIDRRIPSLFHPSPILSCVVM